MVVKRSRWDSSNCSLSKVRTSPLESESKEPDSISKEPFLSRLRPWMRRLPSHSSLRCLLLLALAILLVACQRQSVETETWVPPYTRLSLRSGGAQLQECGETEWAEMEPDQEIIIQSQCHILTDADEGAAFDLADGSTLDLDPASMVALHNPGTLPHLRITLQEGSLRFTAHEPSYEIIIPACSMTFLTTPSQVRVQVEDDTTHAAIEEGAMACPRESGALTLLRCQEIHTQTGEDFDITEFCVVETPTVPMIRTRRPSPTPVELQPTETTRPVFAPTWTPSPTSEIPTDTPPPPPPPTSTRRRPTRTPVPPSPPPPPTDTPPPPPTDTPRPTPTPPPPPTNTPRPTSPPPSPTPNPSGDSA